MGFRSLQIREKAFFVDLHSDDPAGSGEVAHGVRFRFKHEASTLDSNQGRSCNDLGANAAAFEVIEVDAQSRSDHALGQVAVERVHRCVLHELEQSGRTENRHIAGAVHDGGVFFTNHHARLTHETKFNRHGATLTGEANADPSIM